MKNLLTNAGGDDKLWLSLCLSSKNRSVEGRWNDGIYPLESSKISASFQEFLQSLGECTNKKFNS